MCAVRVNCEKTGVEIRTHNPVHECEFAWNIENATKFTRRVNSHSFPEDSGCHPRFRLVAKFNEKYPGISNVNIGVQRTDDGKDMIHVSVDISIESVTGVVYRNKKLNYSTGGDGSPAYVFSELFTPTTSILKFQTSFSSDDTKRVFSELEKNSLVGSYKQENEVMVLPHDILVVRGRVRTHGCCVVTQTLEPKSILDDVTRQIHVSQLLMDLQTSYQEKQFTDVDLVVGDATIPVHRFVLGLRSPVFRRMFDHDTLEKSTGKVDITDFDQEVVENFVWYLYSGIVKESSWEFTCSLYEIAQKYEVVSLVKACASILSKLIDDVSACGILQIADLHCDEFLKSSAMEHITKYFSVVKLTPEWESILNSNQKLAAEALTEVSLSMSEKVYH